MIPKNPLNDDDWTGNDDQIQALKDALEVYCQLHDRLSDMIEEGRLTESDISDDYQWLVGKLVDCASLNCADL
jgi:hypothetical protein